MVYSGAWGKLTHEKNQKLKISWRCPFKAAILKTPPSPLPYMPNLDQIFQPLLQFCLNDNPEIHHSLHKKIQFFLIQLILFAELADLPP